MSNDKMSFQHTKDAIQVFINDRSLIDMLREYEKPFAIKENPSPEAGGYAPVQKEDFLSQSFIGESDDHLLLYSCKDCKESGCWPMLVKVKNVGTKVVWSDFEQPHRDLTSHNFWDYSHFGPFYFDALEYHAQMSSFR